MMVVTLTSCAAWRAEETSEVGHFPKDLDEMTRTVNTSLSLNLYEVFSDGKLDTEESSDTEKAKIHELTMMAYSESKLFNLVDKDSPNSQMSIEVNIVRKRERSLFRTVLSALTLYLIPKRTNEEIVVTTKFIDKKGILVGMVEKTETIVVWHQFFMLFAFPFSIPSTITEEAIIDLSRATILDAFSDGYFVELNS